MNKQNMRSNKRRSFKDAQTSLSQLACLMVVAWMCGCGGEGANSQLKVSTNQTAEIPQSAQPQPPKVPPTTDEPRESMPAGEQTESNSESTTPPPAEKKENASETVIDKSPTPQPVVIPGTATDAVALLDMSKLDPLELQQMSNHTNTELDYTSSLAAEPALSRHLKLLQQAGWKVLEKDGAMDSSGFSRRLFEKNNYVVELSINRHSQRLTGVRIAHVGNVDARKLPLLDNSKHGQSSSFGNASYKTDHPVPEAIASLQSKMADLGWIEFESKAEVSARPYPASGGRIICYVQNGVTCYLDVRPPSGFFGKRTSVNYVITGFIANGVAIPAGATKVRLDESVGNTQFVMNRSLAETLKLLEAQFKSAGWKEEPKLRKAKGQTAEITFLVDDSTAFTTWLVEDGATSTRVDIHNFDVSDVKARLAEKE